MKTNCTKNEAVEAGEQVLILYNDGRSANSLDDLRYKMFCSKVAGGTTYLQVHSLPPTSAAARYHSLRVYFQVQQWIGNDTLHPDDWGWMNVDSRYVPYNTDLPPAPSKLLSVIRCCCKADCDTKRCSCRKHGLDFSPACGECHGLQCSNSVKGYPEVNEVKDL